MISFRSGFLDVTPIPMYCRSVVVLRTALVVLITTLCFVVQSCFNVTSSLFDLRFVKVRSTNLT